MTCEVARRGAAADSALPLEDGEKDSTLFVLDLLKQGVFDLVINIPDALNAFNVKEETQGYRLRRMAIDFGVPLITNAKVPLVPAHPTVADSRAPFGKRRWPR